ncbi:MAG: hypothetical protein UW75_C0032G0005 [Parcubacteria group bacterium GW2011_GWF2_44_8]|nr:MAG: hypothetical protein UW75_C0032G0005 [Parcubacteria group bacterium GW2011_GWF2_44_8]
MICLNDLSPTKINLDNFQDRILNFWSNFQISRSISDNAILLRFLSFDEQTMAIKVATDITYRDVVGLRKPEAAKPAPFYVVTAIAKVVTSDNFVVWQERDTGDWPHSIELSGGFLRALNIQNGVLSVDDFITDRVARDFGIAKTYLTNLEFHSLFMYDAILEAMCCYTLNLTLSRDELIKLNPEHSFHFTKTDFNPTVDTIHGTLPLHQPSVAVWERLK